MKRQSKSQYKIVADFEVTKLTSKDELELIEVYMGDVIAELFMPPSSNLDE